MPNITPTLLATTLALSVHAASSAAVVTDVPGQASFEGCGYLTCIPGKTWPTGLVASKASLNFSQAATAFETIGLTLQAAEPVQITSTLVQPGVHNVLVEGLSVTSVTYDDTAHALLGAAASGAFSLSVGRQIGLATGGTVSVSDFKVDMSTQLITVDIVGHRDAFSSQAADDFTLNDVSLWHFSQVAGPAAFDPPALFDVDGASLAVYTLSGLTLTADGLTSLTRGLGLQTVARGVLGSPQDWGSFSIDLHYGHAVSSVPEPAAWVLMAAGLVGLTVARRRQGFPGV